MSRARKIFWAFSFIAVIFIACLNLFYFGFENIKTRECGSGNMQSCYELGFAYYNEIERVKKDTAAALKYLQKACGGKHAQSCQYLGGITADSQKSVNYYELACDYGLLESCYTLARLYKNEPAKNLPKSLFYYEKLCEQNYKNSCYSAAWIYSHDKTPTKIKDYKRGLFMFKNLCDESDFAACYAAGWLYYMNKVESPQSLAQALDYFAKSCENGYKKGCDAVEIHENAVKKFEENVKSCESGSIQDCDRVAQAYRNGKTVQKNLTKAAEYYSKACDEYDSAKSCESAYLMYTKPDLVKKMIYAKKACDRKIYKACIYVGQLYLHIYDHSLDYRLAYIQNPDILPKDPKKALQYYKKAYENGIDDGYYQTGLAYFREKEIYNLKLAEKFLKIACEKNDKYGCFYLSEVYEKGKDLQNAMIYAEKGCGLEHTPSCDQIKRLEKKLNK
ncbi:MAG: sel1 repeat family protein [Campylobacteraceae bacterium]|jgi:TPR repeat protein|nr:sel1 repeat family protein [Campylobacteraceae bacterium]